MEWGPNERTAGTQSASALNFPVPRRSFLLSMLEWKIRNLVAHYSLGDGMRTFFTMAGAFLYGKHIGAWNMLQSAAVPLHTQCCQLCRDFPVQHWCLGHWLCWHKKGNCTRSSALKINEVSTARLVEETLRALVVTGAVGASQNWGETHTCCEPSGSQRATVIDVSATAFPVLFAPANSGGF